MDTNEKLKTEKIPDYVPTREEEEAIMEVFNTLDKGRSVISKPYNYFNNRNLLEVIDDWTKRWNGYIPPMNPLLDQTQSQIFVNFTRNAIISYLAKVAMSPVKAKIIAVNKKTGIPDKAFADVLKDLNQYSLNAESGEKKFMEAAMECAVKGTVVVYEGYMKNDQKVRIPDEFDFKTGKYKWKEEKRVIFDNCFQQVVPLEDFYITNAFQSDVQKQPKLLWKTLTSHYEASMEFSHYKNWEFVKPGSYVTANDITSFYRETLLTALGKDQAEILKYYCRKENRHIIMVNGVILYDGVIPFKDGKYPFGKTVNEPFGNDFFWGNGHPGKYMGEQDLVNTFINLMADKSINSLVPTGLSSDLDDLVEDNVIQIGKIRKVQNVANWQWWTAPEVGTGEMNFFNQVLNLARESANTDAGYGATPKGGKQTARQILQKQQEVMQKLSFNMNFLEDLERDRTELRLSHILQFYSIPKMEKITGKGSKEIQKMVFRDIQLNETKLSDGQSGSKVIKLVSKEYLNADKRQKLADELSITEAHAELNGQNLEALAVVVDTFYDYNYEVQVVKNSSYEKNQALDQASRMEFSNWRIPLATPPAPGAPASAPADIPSIVKWVEESFDAPSDDFEKAPDMGQQQQPPQPGQPPQQGGGQFANGKPQTLKQLAPSTMRQGAMNQTMG